MKEALSDSKRLMCIGIVVFSGRTAAADAAASGS
jgi:hypothetical protein